MRRLKLHMDMHPIPAGQYVRMSDDQQQYSIENQKAAIKEYADSHGFQIVKTYADPGRSGVAAVRRTALQQLLKDVQSGKAEYKAILVYDVSRWGRFPNNDEAAHYEFICWNSGIPLHYCAEPFSNDGTATSSLLKALKRSMAAEFSRELSEKVIRGKTRLVNLGYWVGGEAGYGYRRLMISSSGQPKQMMNPGDQKSLTTDRVILVPGPTSEVEAVRLMFSMAIKGKGTGAIANELNRRGVSHYGKPWRAHDVFRIVTHPKYAGCNVWNRTSYRLQARRTQNAAQLWITRPGAFEPIVDLDTFEQAQRRRKKKSDYRWSKSEMLQKIRGLLIRKGRLSETLLMKARGMPSTTTIRAHFGTFRKLYEMVGYHLDTEDILKREQCKRSLKLRRTVVHKIKEMFPEHVSVTHLPGKGRTRSMLLIDREFMVSVLFCRRKCKHGTLVWALEPAPGERDYITLVCTMNTTHDRVISYFVLPNMAPFKSKGLGDGRLKRGHQLNSLTELYSTVRQLWAARLRTVRVCRSTFP